MNDGDPAAAGVWPTLFGSVGALFTTVVIPIVNYLAQKYGENYLSLLAGGFAVGYVLFWWGFSPENPWMFIPLPLFCLWYWRSIYYYDVNDS